MRAYIDDCGKYLMKTHDQRTRTIFLEIYRGLSLYDIYFQRRYSIDDEYTKVLKGYGYDIIGNPDNPYGTSTDHEYFFIYEELFDTILETEHN